MKKSLFTITLLVFLTLSGAAFAKVYIDLSAPALKKVPVAVQDFKYLGPRTSASSEEAQRQKAVNSELVDAVKSDLRFSNLFSIIEKEAFLEDPEKSGLTESEINFKDWRAVGAEGLIKGGYAIEEDRLVVELRYFDCVSGKQVLGKKYVGPAGNPRKIVHYFSDKLYEELTGRKGVFTTKLVFVSDKTGNKEVYMSDYDGRNASQITRNRSINLTPQWSPDGKKVMYVSYKKGGPALYSLDLATGKDSVISAKPGINIAGRFSPDGKRVALTMSSEKSPELFLLDTASGEYKKLTDNHGIDVSPAWSPDGARMAFISDISGNPHIFMLDLASGNIKRLTFSGKYNSSPAWSPDGKLIAFSRSDGGAFNIWVMAPDGGSTAQLTFEGNNRSPSWSPEGRHIIYSSSKGGKSSLYIMLADGTGKTKLETGLGNEKAPSWSPYLQ